MKDYKTAVYIGRFQPLHDGHVEVIKMGLEIADKVVVIIGSANGAKTIKNPWTFREREAMIRATVKPDGYTYHPNLLIKPLRDYYYNDNAWLSNVQAITDKYISEGDSVALLGSYKDGTSHYLNWFPQWDFVTKRTKDINSTDIRTALLDQNIGRDWEGKATREILPEFPVPDSVKEFLAEWQRKPEYVELVSEYHFLKDYKKKWEDAPFDPTFATADAVVVCSGHVLVVKRKHNPGKGLFALPGGFKKVNETFRKAALRELKEETGIRIEKIILDSSIVDEHLFDHPDRSLRGCTISNAYHIKLKDGKLPEVKGGDDAESAIWMPIWDVNKNEHNFFEDHVHIINYFLGA